ncbi:MAG: hypothetical protein WCX69_05300, partial [Candidatus Paceibacterota bacterium]
MNLFLKKIYFLIVAMLIAVFQAVPVLANVVSGADEVWTMDVVIIPDDAVDSSEVSTDWADAAVIGHADEVWNYGFETISDDVIDSADADFTIFIEAAICHADEVWGNGLDSVEIGNGDNIPTKTPVLFVPGLLGTELTNDKEKFWFDEIRTALDFSDSFMDYLRFDDNLITVNKDILIDKVIKEKPTFHYTDLLITEFANQGYVEERDFFTFPYDWRYGVSGTYPVASGVSQRPKANSDLLKEKIDQILAQTNSDRIDVIAHSMGGLVVKKYIIENDDPKIGKLVFVGVPNLGSPRSAQALLAGTDLGVFGLNPQEFKKISRNMPAAYDLLPTREYYNARGSFMTVFKSAGGFTNQMEALDFDAAINNYSRHGLNSAGLANANNLHSSAFDFYAFDSILNIAAKGIQAYNIVGCKSGTLGSIEDWENAAGAHGYFSPGAPITGDDTVPFESANSIPVDDDRKFYFQKVPHGQMPSVNGIRQKIVNIIAGVNYAAYPNLVTQSQLAADRRLCELYGDNIIVKSPVDIYVADGSGNVVLGVDNDGNTHYDLPGASFEIADGHKYVYLPSDMLRQYEIKLKGAGTGTFTLIDQKIEANQATAAKIFNDIPVVPEFSGSLNIDGAASRIVPDSGAVIEPTSEIQGTTARDSLAPKTITSVLGQAGSQNYYRGPVEINLSVQDFAQEGIIPAGVFSVNYRLDDGEIVSIKNLPTTIPVETEGTRKLVFYATDKLGNKEDLQTLDFTIDNTPPEIKFQFDQIKKDLAFSAVDNISAPIDIVISDQNGAVAAIDQ